MLQLISHPDILKQKNLEKLFAKKKKRRKSHFVDFDGFKLLKWHFVRGEKTFRKKKICTVLHLLPWPAGPCQSASLFSWVCKLRSLSGVVYKSSTAPSHHLFCQKIPRNGQHPSSFLMGWGLSKELSTFVKSLWLFTLSHVMRNFGKKGREPPDQREGGGHQDSDWEGIKVPSVKRTLEMDC